MFHKENPEYNRRRVGFYTLDELVPKDHFLRKVEETMVLAPKNETQEKHSC